MKFLFKLLAVICAIGLLVSCEGSDPATTVAKRYAEATYSGDSNALMAMIYLDEKDRNQPGLKEFLNGKIKQMVIHAKEIADKNGGVKDITVSKPNYSNDKKYADVVVTITFKKSEQSKQEQIRLINTDDGWKLRI